MCGIVGWITSESKIGEQRRADFLRQGLIVDTLRGDDSTGVFGVGHEPLFKDKEDLGPMWCKSVDNGYGFIHSDAYVENFYDVSDYRVCVGHNRSATFGGVSSDTAHPFVVGPITLVHNGTLITTHDLPTSMYTLEDCDVDSHAIAHNLALHDVSEVIKSLNGAFVLIWHDARDESVNIIRNHKRPLHMALSKRQDTIYFASEGPMLDFLGKRLGLELGGIYYPKDGQHLKWLKDTDVDSPIVTDIDLYEGWEMCGGVATQYTGQIQTPYGFGSSWYDDDEDDWRNEGIRGGGAAMGKPLVDTDDRVFVGGMKKAVPMLLQEELMKLDLLVDDRLVFSPRTSLPLDPGRNVVYGLLPNGLKAVIYSVLQTTSLGRMNQEWTVRPIAVYVRPSGEPMIVVKLVNTNGKDLASFSTGKCPDTGLTMDENGEPLLYRGAYGAMYGQKAWHVSTQGGCGFCGGIIRIIDAEETEWVGDGSIPLCMKCEDMEIDEEDIK